MLRMRRLTGGVCKQAASFLERYAPFSVQISKVVDLLDAPPGILSAYLTRRRVFTSRQIRKMVPGLARHGWESGLNEGFYQLLETMVSGRAVQDAVGLLEMRAYMGQTLLRDSDVMGMAHGLEIRVPFLDCDFSSSALMLGAASRTPRSRPKWRFVEAMGDYLPGDIVNRTKKGFTLPLKEWMLGELKDEVADGLRALLWACPQLQQNVLLGLWKGFIAQPERIGWYRPWILFVLGRYLKKHRLEAQA
jgi:asparagine synthase (glutamine-hydrolysing)